MHPIYHRIVNRQNILIVCAVIILAFSFWYFESLQQWYGRLEDIFSDVAAYNQVVAGGIFIVLSVISAMLSFFTSTPLVPAVSHLWGRDIAFLLLYGSWIIGGMLTYCIGYHAQGLVRRFSVYRKAQEYLDHLRGRSDFPLVILFRLAAPSEVGGYTLGILRYPFWRYMLATAVSELPFAIVGIYSSEALISRQPLVFILEIVASIAFIGAVFYFFHQRLAKQSEPQ